MVTDINSLVDNFPTEYKEGFTSDEIDLLLKCAFVPVKELEEKFYEEMKGQTGMIIDGNMLLYHSDIKQALLKSLGILKTNSFD